MWFKLQIILHNSLHFIMSLWFFQDKIDEVKPFFSLTLNPDDM